MAEQNDGFDFAVPGEGEASGQDIVQMPAQEAPAPRQVSLFWLLQHYNKENAAAYKLQRARKKAEKRSQKSSKKAGRQGKREHDVPVGRPVGPAPVSDAAPINQGQRIPASDGNFGETVYIERDSRPGLAGSQALAQASLECIGYGQTVILAKVPFLIGRSKQGVDLCIADNKTVGRTHAVITFRCGQYCITDLKSLNHVYIDGMPVEPEVETPIHDGCRIALGNEEFIFHL